MVGDDAKEILWVLQAQLGDRDALEALLQAVQGPLYRSIERLVSDRALAEDLLQDVLLRIYRKLLWLRDPELFRPWCYRIMTREVFRRLKRERSWADQLRDPSALAAVEAEPGETPAEPELLVKLPDFLRRISPASRVVLALHYLDQLSLEEVAEVLGVAVGTVKSRLAYGLAALRRILRDEEKLRDGPDPRPRNCC